MFITIMSGSPRNKSNTMRVCKAMKLALAARGYQNVSLIDFHEYDIPLLNQGSIKRDQMTPFQQKLVHSWEKSTLVFVVTPEYNWFPSAELINMIHQLGDIDFRDLFDNRVFAFAGVSNGRGGRMPAVQLSYVINKIVNVLNTVSVSSPKVFESQFTPKVLDEEGLSLGNPDFDKGLDAFVDYSLNLANRWSGNRELSV